MPPSRKKKGEQHRVRVYQSVCVCVLRCIATRDCRVSGWPPVTSVPQGQVPLPPKLSICHIRKLARKKIRIQGAQGRCFLLCSPSLSRPTALRCGLRAVSLLRHTQTRSYRRRRRRCLRASKEAQRRSEGETKGRDCERWESSRSRRRRGVPSRSERSPNNSTSQPTAEPSIIIITNPENFRLSLGLSRLLAREAAAAAPSNSHKRPSARRTSCPCGPA